jgi:hypothetical protein
MGLREEAADIMCMLPGLSAEAQVRILKGLHRKQDEIISIV